MTFYFCGKCKVSVTGMDMMIDAMYASKAKKMLVQAQTYMRCVTRTVAVNWPGEV